MINNAITCFELATLMLVALHIVDHGIIETDQALSGVQVGCGTTLTCKHATARVHLANAARAGWSPLERRPLVVSSL